MIYVVICLEEILCDVGSHRQQAIQVSFRDELPLEWFTLAHDYMTISSKQFLWVWYDIELMKTHYMDHVEKINMSTKIEGEFELRMHVTKWTRIDKTSVEY